MAGVTIENALNALNADCLEELFEWLSVKDLLTLRLMCIRLKRVVDHFLAIRLPKVKTGYRYIGLNQMACDYDDELHLMDSIERAMVKQLSIVRQTLNEDDVRIVRSFLPRIEKLHIVVTYLCSAELYETILKWCSNLKHLLVNGVMAMDWLRYDYPALESLNIDKFGMDYTQSGFAAFLGRNPNIQTLTVSSGFLCANWENLLRSNAEIDLLRIDGRPLVRVRDLIEIIYRLYGRGFYKRLHLTALGIGEQNQIDELSMVHGLELLCLPDATTMVWPNVSALGIGRCVSAIPNPMIQRLTDLGRVHFGTIGIDWVTALIQFAPMVHTIEIRTILAGLHLRDDFIDLAAWNRMRKRLINSRKVTVYVNERIFLTTKHGSATTEYERIELKRAQASPLEWHRY